MFLQLLITLFQTTHLNAIEKHEKHLDRLVLVSAVNDHELLDLDYSAIVFAQELTRIELEHLCFLGPEELVHAFAKDMKSSSQSLPTDDVEAEAQVKRSYRSMVKMDPKITFTENHFFLNLFLGSKAKSNKTYKESPSLCRLV